MPTPRGDELYSFILLISGVTLILGGLATAMVFAFLVAH